MTIVTDVVVIVPFEYRHPTRVVPRWVLLHEVARGIVLFLFRRYRHVQLVRRTIGGKQGTGGSPGVGYLERTLFDPVFPDLWAIRPRF